MKRELSEGRLLSPAGGIAIDDVDLARPLPLPAVERIRQALRAHHVVVFPGQALNREQQHAFSAQLGEVERHGNKRRDVAHVTANLDASGAPTDRFASGANYRWHTDKPYWPVPPAFTTLHAVELPARGGDTEFANTAMAYDALPEETKRRIAGLRVVFRWSLRGSPTADAPCADHPLVRTHPETGRKALYLGNHATQVIGLPEMEGAGLLEELLRHATEPRFVYVHRWQPGDLVIWDNRGLLHRAVANYDMNHERRVMHRNVVRGTTPF